MKQADKIITLIRQGFTQREILTQKIIFLFILFLIGYPSPTFGQNESDTILPVLTKDKIWSIGSFSSEEPIRSEYYKIWKDSIFNGKNYSLIITSTDKDHIEWDTIHFYLLREEDDRIYYSEDDILFYDFSMQIGDSIDDYGFSMVLDSIKWLPIYNGELRKHMYLSPPSYSHNCVVWIEGIGSNGGLMDPTGGAFSGGGYDALLCVQQADELIYKYLSYDWCYIYEIESFNYSAKEWNIGNITQKENIQDTSSFSYFIDGSYIKGSAFVNLYKIEGNDTSYIGGLRGANSIYAAGQIYFRPADEDTMKLIYDFNLREGEYFVTPDAQDTLLVDSLQYKTFAGKERLHWYMHSIINPNFPQTVWIEGIGRPDDFLQSTVTSESDRVKSFLLCFSQNNELLYQNPEFNTCSFSSSTKANRFSLQKDLLNLFISDDGTMNIQLNTNIPGEIRLYSIDGKQLVNEKIETESQSICLPTTGVLIYHFINTRQQIQTGKIIVK